jgi:hypothetical protein
MCEERMMGTPSSQENDHDPCLGRKRSLLRNVLRAFDIFQVANVFSLATKAKD